MNVTQLTAALSYRSGGVFEVICSLSNNLVRNYDLNISVCGLKDVDGNVQSERFNNKIKLLVSDYIGPSNFCYSPTQKKIMLNNSIDIVHQHGHWMYQSVINLDLRKTLSIISSHGMLDRWALNNNYLKKQIAHMIFEKDNIKKAKKLIALNTSEADTIIDFCNQNKVEIIPNGVDIPEVYKCKSFCINEIEKMHKGLNLENKRVFLFLGRIHAKKGIFELIESWKKCNMNAPFKNNNILVVAGWGDEFDEVNLKKSIMNDDNIKFIGKVDRETRELCYSVCDIFVLPSYSEGLPMTVLEAWAYKKPVAITKECNLSDEIQYGAGIHINNSVNILMSQLLELSNVDEKELINIGEYGFNLVKRKYSWSVISAQYNELYNDIIRVG